MSSKPLDGSKDDSAFHPSEVNQMKIPGLPGGLVIKIKLSPHSGCSLETGELHPLKGAIECFFKIILEFSKGYCY